MVPVSLTEFNDVYVVTELLETDLHQVRLAKNPGSRIRFSTNKSRSYRLPR